MWDQSRYAAKMAVILVSSRSLERLDSTISPNQLAFKDMRRPTDTYVQYIHTVQLDTTAGGVTM